MGNTTKKIVKVTADIKQNRLIFVIAGQIRKKDLGSLYTDVRFAVADLKKNFDVITDLTECHFLHPSALGIFHKIMNFLIASEAGVVVRILKDQGLALQQIINLASRLQGYKPLYAASLEEAEVLLEKLSKREGLRFSLHNKQVIYRYLDQENYGMIDDISISGCLIKAVKNIPSLGDEVRLSLTFNWQEGEPEIFEFFAQVVRQEEGCFAVTYVNFEETDKKRLWEMLVQEAGRDIDSS